MELADQKQLPKWGADYLQYLKIPIRKPSYEYLKEICTAHLNRIPFTNINSLLYYREYHKHKKLYEDVEGFVNKLVQYNMGETCYIMNSSLHQLLKQLGFRSRYACLNEGHLALLVRVPNENEEVYVDCGNAAPFFHPVRFTTDPDNVSEYGGIEVRFRSNDDTDLYNYYRYVDGKLVTDLVWSFDINKTYQFADFQTAINNYFQPNSFFMSSLRCQLWQLDQKRSLSLVNNVFSIRYSDRKVEKHILRTKYDIREVINHEFHLPKLPVEDAIMVLEELGVDLFHAKS